MDTFFLGYFGDLGHNITSGEGQQADVGLKIIIVKDEGTGVKVPKPIQMFSFVKTLKCLVVGEMKDEYMFQITV